MGRPQELSEEERQELLAQGYKPVEIWVLDMENPEVRARIEQECAAIRESDRRSGELEWLDEVVADLWDDRPK